MNISSDSKDSLAKKKLVAKIQKQLPHIGNKELRDTLQGIKRFVSLVQKIRTEPQAQIIYSEKKIAGRIVRTRETNIDYQEFIKVKGSNEKSISITEAMRRLASHYPERKHAGRRKKV
jgi:hypothetical protein